MRTIKLTLEYDGTDFHGWQTQTAGHFPSSDTPHPRKRTVQEEIEKSLNKILNTTTKVRGAGRTDSGVHAMNQVAHFHTSSSMKTAEMHKALNALLPADIAVLRLEDVPATFHAQYGAKSKTYRYTILTRQARSALQRRDCLHYPYTLNLRRMRDEAKALIGRKDFKSFTASDPAKRNAENPPNTQRTVKRITISKKGELIHIDIEADGFLYKMVRNIVGALLKAGRGEMSKGGMRKILAQKDRRAAAKTAPAKGLTLVEVRYSRYNIGN